MKWIRDNGLTLALMALFALSVIGQAWSGWLADIEEHTRHGEAPPALMEYLSGGQFLSALFENWESEFLQMWAFVMLTAYLIQKGSPESKKPGEKNPQDRDPVLDEKRKDAPWPVRAGGLVRVVYSHSLGFALLALFVAAFVLHWISSARHAADEAQAHGERAPTLLQHLEGAQFWFESFQNWQSEFLSTAVLIVLGIFLRERHSPESKPVGAPHSKTGTD
jgi:hypothetical protein